MFVLFSMLLTCSYLFCNKCVWQSHALGTVFYKRKTLTEIFPWFHFTFDALVKYDLIHNRYLTCSLSFLFYCYHRLLVLCLLKNDGVLQMAREFGGYCQREDSFNEHLKPTLIRVAQIVASIPDKARSRAPTSLASQYPFCLSHVVYLVGSCGLLYFHKFLLRWWMEFYSVVNILAVWH